MKYTVKIEELLIRMVEVEAEDPIKARSQVVDAFADGKVVLGDDDFEDVEITVL